jgi:tyrosinase
MDALTPKDFTEHRDLLDNPGRRVFVQGVGLVSVALLSGVLGGCEALDEAIRNRPMRRRLRTGSVEVDGDINTYRQAVAAMKALPASNPISWAAQAGIHGTVSGGFNFCQHGTQHFFDWHRAYLFYFEKICQKLTGNAKFGLPYWNWNQNPGIHAAFLDTTSTLFLSRTRTSMSGSSSITTATLDPIFADTNLFTFGSQLEGTPHNNVHSFIGGTMGSGGSALDPLFWMHHCMVDYCWYKWNIDLDNDNTNDSAWINTVDSHFVDANGNAATALAGITTLMPLLSYQYESSAIGSAASATSLRRKSEFLKVEKRIRAGADIKYDIQRRVRLADRAVTSIARPFATETRLTAEDLSSIVNSDTAKERVFASIEYAQLPATSDFAVRVFVNLPNASSSTSIDDPHYAGSFAFFGTTPEAPAATEHRHQPAFLVDLTNTVQRLKRTQQISSTTPLTLQLVPTPFGDKFEKDDTELTLTAIEIIITPVIIRSTLK